MTNLDAIKKIAANLGGDAAHCRTNAEALNIVAENVASPSGSSGGVWDFIDTRHIEPVQNGNKYTFTIESDANGNPVSYRAFSVDVDCTACSAATNFNVGIHWGSASTTQTFEIPANSGVEIVWILDGWGGYTIQQEQYDSDYNPTSKEIDIQPSLGSLEGIRKIEFYYDNSDGQTAVIGNLLGVAM